MKFKNEHIDRFFKLAESLSSNIISNSGSFDDFYDTFHTIYIDNFSPTSLWDDYINWFTIIEARDAIRSLNIRKNPGPMGIYPVIIKNNEFLRHY